MIEFSRFGDRAILRWPQIWGHLQGIKKAPCREARGFRGGSGQPFNVAFFTRSLISWQTSRAPIASFPFSVPWSCESAVKNAARTYKRIVSGISTIMVSMCHDLWTCYLAPSSFVCYGQSARIHTGNSALNSIFTQLRSILQNDIMTFLQWKDSGICLSRLRNTQNNRPCRLDTLKGLCKLLADSWNLAKTGMNELYRLSCHGPGFKP
jgi:hypothetical protein